MNAKERRNHKRQPRIYADDRGYCRSKSMLFLSAYPRSSAQIRGCFLLSRVLRSCAFICGLVIVAVAACSGNRGDGIEAVGTVEIREHDVAPMTAARVVQLLVDE